MENASELVKQNMSILLAAGDFAADMTASHRDTPVSDGFADPQFENGFMLDNAPQTAEPTRTTPPPQFGNRPNVPFRLRSYASNVRNQSLSSHIHIHHVFYL